MENKEIGNSENMEYTIIGSGNLSNYSDLNFNFGVVDNDMYIVVDIPMNEIEAQYQNEIQYQVMDTCKFLDFLRFYGLEILSFECDKQVFHDIKELVNYLYTLYL